MSLESLPENKNQSIISEKDILLCREVAKNLWELPEIQSVRRREFPSDGDFEFIHNGPPAVAKAKTAIAVVWELIERHESDPERRVIFSFEVFYAIAELVAAESLEIKIPNELFTSWGRFLYLLRLLPNGSFLFLGFIYFQHHFYFHPKRDWWFKKDFEDGYIRSTVSRCQQEFPDLLISDDAISSENMVFSSIAGAKGSFIIRTNMNDPEVSKHLNNALKKTFIILWAGDAAETAGIESTPSKLDTFELSVDIRSNLRKCLDDQVVEDTHWLGISFLYHLKGLPNIDPIKFLDLCGRWITPAASVVRHLIYSGDHFCDTGTSDGLFGKGRGRVLFQWISAAKMIWAIDNQLLKALLGDYIKIPAVFLTEPVLGEPLFLLDQHRLRLIGTPLFPTFVFWGLLTQPTSMNKIIEKLPTARRNIISGWELFPVEDSYWKPAVARGLPLYEKAKLLEALDAGDKKSPTS